MQARSDPIGVVSGCDISGYGILRALGTRGVTAVALTDGVDDFARASRYCCETIAYPRVRGRFSANCPCAPDATQVTQQLLLWAARQSTRPVLFATSDWFVSILAHHRASLSHCFEYAWLSPQTYALIKDKASMWEFCGRAGVEAPRTHALATEQDVKTAARRLAFPCVLKPVRNFDIDLPLFDHDKVVVLKGARDLENLAARHPEIVGATVAQEMVEGADDQVVQCTLAMGRSGGVLGVSTVRKLHQYPAGFGSMCFGRREHIPGIVPLATAFLNALEYRGLASLEFKFSRRDGRFYFIEINPRLPWYNSLFAATEPNLAYLNYLDLCGCAPAEAAPTRASGAPVHWSSFREEHKRSVAEGGRWSRVLPIATAFRSRAHAWFDSRDPGPFAAFALSLCRTFLQRLRRPAGGQAPVAAAITQPRVPAVSAAPERGLEVNR